jgi:apolipoprotein N-acyltransferase
VLEARVPLLTGRTLAERLGGWPEYVITALTILALVAAAAGAVAGRRAGRRAAGGAKIDVRSPTQ